MMPFSTKPSRREMIFGGIYLGLYAAVLPWLLPVAVLALWPDLSAAQVNFIYFTMNFAAVTVIFRKFLSQTARDTLQNPSNALWCGIAAYGANLILTALVAAAILRLDPAFSNVNNDSLNTMFREERQLLFLAICGRSTACCSWSCPLSCSPPPTYCCAARPCTATLANKPERRRS